MTLRLSGRKASKTMFYKLPAAGLSQSKQTAKKINPKSKRKKLQEILIDLKITDRLKKSGNIGTH